MKTLYLILLVVFGFHGTGFASPLKATKFVDKKSIPELAIVYSKVLSKGSDGSRVLSWDELALFHERLLERIGPGSRIIQKYATKFGKDPTEIGGDLLAKDLYRALSGAIDSKNYKGLPVLKGDSLDYLIQIFKVENNPKALDGLIETMIMSRGATGSRDMSKLLKNLSFRHGEMIPPRSLEDIFKKIGELDEDVIGVNYSRFADYDGNVDLKQGRVYKGLLDVLQNNKSPEALNGVLYELDCAHFFSVIEISGYRVLHIGRKFAVGTGRSRRLSDIDLVVKLPSGQVVFVQSKATMGALQNKPEAFGRNFQKQLAQLPTTGNNAVIAASQGERFVKHVLIAMPESQYDPLLFNKAVNKMVEGMADSQRVSVQKVRRQMRKGWGQVDNGEDELSEIETDRLVILIN